jgi:hypothetical protein
MPETRLVEAPHVGDVIRYRYLWAEEAAQGLDPKVPHRPCIVVQAAPLPDKKWEVLVVPLTDNPQSGGKWMTVPENVRRNAGLLDKDASYVVFHEGNAFRWPSWDVIPIDARRPKKVVRGRITEGFMGAVRAGFASVRAEHKARVVDREKLDRENVRTWRARER